MQVGRALWYVVRRSPASFLIGKVKMGEKKKKKTKIRKKQAHRAESELLAADLRVELAKTFSGKIAIT